MFVKFNCGCVGVPLDGRKAMIAVACDEDRDAPSESLSWFARDVSDKTFEALDPMAEGALHVRMASRMARANRFDAIRAALDV